MKSLIFKWYAGLVKRSLSFFGESTRNAFCADVAGLLNDGYPLETKHGPLRLYSPGEYTTIRAETFFDKEPETLDWIDSFSDDDVLWDIGANVGCYTLYAARKGNRVVAFEPAYTNYYILNRNILLNDLGERAVAYNVALADAEGLGSLNMSNTQLGGAFNQFEADGTQASGSGETSVFRQGMVGFSVDGFLELYDGPFPTQIKIDVDGIEDKILQGAAQTLADPRLKSVSIEVEEGTPLGDAILKFMDKAGLVMTSRRHAEIYDDGPWAHAYNCVFSRKERA